MTIAPTTEYATTHFHRPWWHEPHQTPMKSPVVPKGEGWEMCGSSSNRTKEDGLEIFWFWRRKVRRQSR